MSWARLVHVSVRLRAAAAALVCAGLAAGCGGGISIGLGYGGDLDQPPEVALAASVTEALPGAIVRLVAAATDDGGVDEVAFMRRLDDGSLIVVATDRSQPFDAEVTVPAVAAGTVLRYVARATDTAGQSRDSAPVSITVR
ncbi:MAG: hypothetical protein U1E89_09010 [Burkholderiaceae bacterium]